MLITTLGGDYGDLLGPLYIDFNFGWGTTGDHGAPHMSASALEGDHGGLQSPSVVEFSFARGTTGTAGSLRCRFPFGRNCSVGPTARRS